MNTPRLGIVLGAVAMLLLACSGSSQVSDVQEADGGPDGAQTNETCLEIQNASINEYPPAGLRLTFRLLNCAGSPVSDLTADELTVLNDDTGLPFGASQGKAMVSAPTVIRDRDLKTVVLVDLSSTVVNLGQVAAMVEGAKALVAGLLDDAVARHSEVAVWAFGSPSKTVLVQDFTADLAVLTEKLEQFKAAQGFGARDLYGAVTKGLNQLAALPQTDHSQRTLVLIAGGLHETGGAAALAAEVVALRKGLEADSGLVVGVVGLATGGFDKLQELASRSDLAFDAQGGAWTKGTQKVTKALKALLGSEYAVGICTPIVYGTPTLTLDIQKGGAFVSKQVSYLVDEFNGDTSKCDPDLLADPCGGMQCGDSALPGFNCGTCTACNGQCVEGICVSDACAGLQCGDDGCGGSCGKCESGQVCNGGLCCTTNCGSRDCGDDGCGGVCGTCDGGHLCDALGFCSIQCQPDCLGRDCGSDSCNGSCGTCQPGQSCNVNGKCLSDCVASCTGKQCGTDGCGGSCGTCGLGSSCNANFQCVPDCVADCSGKQCGSDGCNGSCGTCSNGKTCNANGLCVTTCTPNCSGKQCGSDGCNGSCGTCSYGKTCNAYGACVTVCTPNCSGKQCGSDGCNGSCGTCAYGKTCNAYGACITTCTPNCSGKQCGSDGCGGSCGECNSNYLCDEGDCVQYPACPHGGIMLSTDCYGTDVYGCCQQEALYYCGSGVDQCPAGEPSCLCYQQCDSTANGNRLCQKEKVYGGSWNYLCSLNNEPTYLAGDNCPWDY